MTGPRGRRHDRRVALTLVLVTAVTTLPLGGLVVLTEPASAATITVDDSGGADYANLQWALDNASAGDVIEVADGTYSIPAGTGPGFVLDKDVTLRGDVGGPTAGAGASAPRIRGYTVALVLTENASGATIEGLEFDSISDGGGIQLDLPAGETLSDVTVRNNTFADLASDDEAGIDGTEIDGNLSSVEVANNRFVGTGANAPYGIRILDDDDGSSSATGTTYANVSIVDNEFESLYHAVDVEHTTPDGAITDLVVTGNDVGPSGQSSWGVLLNVDGNADGTIVSGVTVADNQLAVGFQPLSLDTNVDEMAYRDVLVEDNTLSGRRVLLRASSTNSTLERFAVSNNTITATAGSSSGLAVTGGDGENGGMHDVVICNNTITAADDAIGVIYGGGTSAGDGNGTDIWVVNNTIPSTGASGYGIQLTGGDRTDDVTIAGNTFGSTGTVGATGIVLDFVSDGGTASDVEVLANEVNGDNQHGIDVTASQAGGDMSGMRIAHNDVHVENESDAHGLVLRLGGSTFGPAMTASDVDVYHNNLSSRAAAIEVDVTSLNSTDPVNLSTNLIDVASADEAGVYVADGGTGIDAEVDVQDNNVTGLGGYAVHVDTAQTLGTTVNVTDNALRNNVAGVFVDGTSNGSLVTATGNNIAGNTFGINNTGAGIVNATDNWWGAGDGPSGGYVDPNDPGITADGSGDTVSNFTNSNNANVDFHPNATTAFSLDLYDPNAPVPAVSCPTVTQGAYTGGSTPTPTPSPTSTPTPTPTDTPAPTATAAPSAPSGGGIGGDAPDEALPTTAPPPPMTHTATPGTTTRPPLPTTTTASATTAPPTTTSTTTTTAGSTTEAPGGQPGFTAVAMLTMLLALAVLARRR